LNILESLTRRRTADRPDASGGARSPESLPADIGRTVERLPAFDVRHGRTVARFRWWRRVRFRRRGVFDVRHGRTADGLPDRLTGGARSPDRLTGRKRARLAIDRKRTARTVAGIRRHISGTVERLPASDGGGAFASGVTACPLTGADTSGAACRIDWRGRLADGGGAVEPLTGRKRRTVAG